MTLTDILQGLQGKNLLKMRTVSEVMQSSVIHASPCADLLSIAQIMASENICSVVIAQEGIVGAQEVVFPVGIIVERDIELLQALQLDLANIQAKTAIASSLFSVRATDSLLDALSEMQRRNLQQLLVIGDAGELVGIVTQTNCLQGKVLVKKNTFATETQLKLEEKTSQLVQVKGQLRKKIIQRQQSEQVYRHCMELETQVAQRTAELLKINKELSVSLEEQNVFEEELRQQNEELFIVNENARLQQQRYEDLFEFAPDAYLVTDANGKIQEANRAASNLLGVSRKYLIGKPVFVFIAKPDRQSFRTQVNLLERVEDWQCYIKPRKSTPLNATITMTSILDRKGKLMGKRLMIRDITERKQAEEKIKQQAALLDITTDAIMVCNLYKQILFWNRGAESLYEWLASEAINQNIQELFDKNNSSQLESAFVKVLEDDFWQGELQQVIKNGKQIVVYSRWTLMRDEQDNPKSILIVNTDITEKKQLEAQYYRAQRLESLGTLASGIAHDLNNILSPILIGTQLLLRKLPYLDEQNRFVLKMLEDNSKRGAQLVKQITSFARGAEGDRVSIQLRHLINEIKRIVNSTFPKSIEFSTKIPTDLWTVQAQPTQIHQILMNLCINARDAMPEGGSLSIAAENRYIDQNYHSMNTEAKVGHYVAISVTDSGCGIPQEIQERIFEPFFTTKEVGKGTGLGLSTTIGIVKNHSGFVKVSSQVGKGSQFEIYLPASPSQEIKQPTEPEISNGNGELILVVDDETHIREMTKNSLITHNYKILTANDGSEALTLYAKYKHEISLVLIDIQMPSIEGFQAIKVLQRMNPDVKIIAMSGLESNRQLIANHVNVEAFLSKPYSLGELLQKIKKVKG